MGGSAGSIEALIKIVTAFPKDLEASVFVVVHIPPFATSHLANILNRGKLRASFPKDGERFRRGHIYVASPDHHLLIEGNKVRSIKGPKENRMRPGIDPLFRSAAQYHPERSIGVILSGTLDDGSAGLWALKRAGGLAVIQALEDAQFPDMPSHAQQQVRIDRVAKAADLAATLADMVKLSAVQAEAPDVRERTKIENAYAKLENVPRPEMDKIGVPSSFVCPSCNGPMWKMRDGPRLFRCHTGHAFTPLNMLFEHREVTERTLAVLMTLFDDEVTLTEEVLSTEIDPDFRDEMKSNLKRSERRATDLRKLLPGGYQGDRS